MPSRRTLITPRLEGHHDQFRTRLDMYRTLVVIFAMLAALSGILSLRGFAGGGAHHYRRGGFP